MKYLDSYTLALGAMLLVASSAAWSQTASGSDLPPGNGRDLVASRCASCHALNILSANPHTADEWSEVAEKMVQRGAKASDDELDIMVDYLAKSFPKTDATKLTSQPASKPAAK